MPQENLARQFLTIAVEMEAAGHAFYESLAREFKAKDLSAVFTRLAEREKGHQTIFLDMVEHVGDHQTGELPGDESSYLKQLAGSAIFGREAASFPASSPRSDIEAMEMGQRMEADSILFYAEARGMLPHQDQHVIDMITDEERKHFSELSLLLDKLKAGSALS